MNFQWMIGQPLPAAQPATFRLSRGIECGPLIADPQGTEDPSAVNEPLTIRAVPLWLRVKRGTGYPVPLEISVDPSGLSVGNHEGQVSVSASCGGFSIPVTLAIMPEVPTGRYLGHRSSTQTGEYSANYLIASGPWEATEDGTAKAIVSDLPAGIEITLGYLDSMDKLIACTTGGSSEHAGKQSWPISGPIKKGEKYWLTLWSNQRIPCRYDTENAAGHGKYVAANYQAGAMPIEFPANATILNQDPLIYIEYEPILIEPPPPPVEPPPTPIPEPPDTTAPVVTILTPLNGATVAATKVKIHAHASDDVTVKRMWLLVNGVKHEIETTDADFTWIWNSRPYKKQSVLLEIFAEDMAGNIESTAITVKVK